SGHRQAGDDHIHLRRKLRPGQPDLPAELRQLLLGSLAPIEPVHLEARLDQVRRHRQPHIAQSDESDLLHARFSPSPASERKIIWTHSHTSSFSTVTIAVSPSSPSRSGSAVPPMSASAPAARMPGARLTVSSMP